MRSKRPWKKYARIERVEMQSGDVKFRTDGTVRVTHNLANTALGEFESLTEAEAHLDAWFQDWWPKQVKSRRPA